MPGPALCVRMERGFKLGSYSQKVEEVVILMKRKSKCDQGVWAQRGSDQPGRGTEWT